MTHATIRKSTWTALAAAALFTVFLGMAPQMNAAEAKRLSTKEVNALIPRAKTPAEHLRLARHYQAEAARFTAEAKEHADMAEMYGQRPTASETKRPGASDTAGHCRRLSEELTKAAGEARELATEHEAMAKEAAAAGK